MNKLLHSINGRELYYVVISESNKLDGGQRQRKF